MWVGTVANRVLTRLREQDVLWTNPDGAKRHPVGTLVTRPDGAKFRVTRKVASSVDPDRVRIYGVRV